MARYENRWREDEDRIGRWDEPGDWRRAEARDYPRGAENRGYGWGEDYDRNPNRDVYGGYRGEYRGRGAYGAREGLLGRNYGRDYRGGYGEPYGREDYLGGYYGARGYGYGDLYDPSYAAGGYRADYGRRPYGGRPYGERDERGFFDRAGDEVASWFGDDEAERRRRMDARRGEQTAQHHRGRGPKSYTRSDERIREDVNDRLTDDLWVDASDVEVRIDNGEVTLDGTVDSRMAKRRAEDIADDISGVKHVQNNLRVQEWQSATDTGALGTTTGKSTTGRTASRRS